MLTIVWAAQRTLERAGAWLIIAWRIMLCSTVDIHFMVWIRRWKVGFVYKKRTMGGGGDTTHLHGQNNFMTIEWNEVERLHRPHSWKTRGRLCVRFLAREGSTVSDGWLHSVRCSGRWRERITFCRRFGRMMTVNVIGRLTAWRSRGRGPTWPESKPGRRRRATSTWWTARRCGSPTGARPTGEMAVKAPCSAETAPCKKTCLTRLCGSLCYLYSAAKRHSPHSLILI